MALQPTSDGLQPTSDGLHPTSDGLQPTSNGLQSTVLDRINHGRITKNARQTEILMHQWIAGNRTSLNARWSWTAGLPIRGRGTDKRSLTASHARVTPCKVGQGPCKHNCSDTYK